ncbi:ATP-binding protein [Rhizobium sp. FKL33]|uniref:sensor histidine kinase n=1 Tax=Rhizobium sp. FKL33 TaxID=2562307 RepID=UPI0010BF755F|nr:ATP-binding protein [Rhizobium sp. FKL33]
MSSSAGEQNRIHGRSRLASAALYLGLQMLVALIAMACFSLPLPAPPEKFALNPVSRIAAGGAEQTVDLPDFSSPKGDEAEIRYRTQFTYSPGAGPWAVFLPRFLVDAAVLVNGNEIGNSGVGLSAGKAQLNLPLIATIPSAVLKTGQNQLDILVRADPPISKHLEAVYAGPESELRPAFNTRTKLFVVLPQIFSAWRVLLGLILAMIWASRPLEYDYGFLTLALLVGAGRLAFLDYNSAAALPYIGMLVVFESALFVSFAYAFLGRKQPGWQPLLFLPGVLIPLLSLAGGDTATKFAFLLLGPPTVLFQAGIIAVILARAAIAGGGKETYIFGSAMTIIIVTVLHDAATLMNLLPGPKYYFSVQAYSAMLIACGILLAARFVQALRKIDGFAQQLIVKIAEAEEKLKQSFAREEARKRAEALSAERERLMRDLHDGLGGQLVRIVALSEQDHEGAVPTGEAARAALRDLRLVIDAMEDVEGDLLLALASWRERTAQHLRVHGIALDWQVRAKPSDLTFPDLRPWHMIQIMRLLDEAVTNAVRHSGAATISIILRTEQKAGERARIHITVRDDGRGLGEAQSNPPGKFGLANMRKRAALCGATLTIESDVYGVSVDLALPESFPNEPSPA